MRLKPRTPIGWLIAAGVILVGIGSAFNAVNSSSPVGLSFSLAAVGAWVLAGLVKAVQVIAGKVENTRTAVALVVLAGLFLFVFPLVVTLLATIGNDCAVSY